MPKTNSDIYGPDLDAQKAEGDRIAAIGMRSMKGVGKTDQVEGSTGDDRSKMRDIEADIPQAKP